MSETFPSAAGVVAVAGKEPPKVIIDFNHDGIDDLKQLQSIASRGAPVAEAFMRALMLGIAATGGSNGKVYRYLNSYFTQYKPQLDAVLGGKP